MKPRLFCVIGGRRGWECHLLILVKMCPAKHISSSCARAIILKSITFVPYLTSRACKTRQMEQIIRHNAVVKAIDGQTVRVTIMQSSACGGCTARKMCNSAEAKEKEVDVLTPDAATYRVGQEVVLEGRLSDGRTAAIIAYVLPLLVLLAALVLAIQFTGSETAGALWALGSVAVYYLLVFLFLRKRLQQRFSFRIGRTS